MSDRATLYRLLQEHRIQEVLDLFDMVVDEYVNEINSLRKRLKDNIEAGNKLSEYDLTMSEFMKAREVWRKLQEGK